MAKFFSKQSNYCVILKPGSQENRITGEPPRPAIKLKFEGGFASRDEEDIIEMAKRNLMFNQEFWMQEEDPLKGVRKESEPRHQIQEIKYGQPEKGISTPKSVVISDELKKLITDQASEMAKAMVKEMLPTAVKEVIAGITAVKPMSTEDVPVGTTKESYEAQTVPAGTVSGLDVDIEKKPFCDQCTSRGVRHLSTCPKATKNLATGV